MRNILAIESSCDETAVAIYNSTRGLLGHSLFSQINLHKDYGGVVPELASRDHLIKITPLINSCLKTANLELDEIDVFAYTKGPGLAGSLLIGAGLANTLAFCCNKPIIGIHHLEGHILSPFLSTNKPNFPFLCLLVSGGHTQLIWIEDISKYQILGETLDDSAGEAFDKTAKLLGMDYPGGPIVSEYALQGQQIYKFPKPMQHSPCLDFSFAGLKTSVLTQVKKMQTLSTQDKYNICASFVHACTDILTIKSVKAIKQKLQEHQKISLVVCGGVSANTQLRDKLNKAGMQNNFDVYYPPLEWCTDNAAMIAVAASLKLDKDLSLASKNYDFEIKPRWDLV